MPRGTLAALVFPAVVVVIGVVTLFGGMIFGMNQARIAMTRAQAVKTEAKCVLVLSALTTFPTDHDGRYPAHALELIEASSLTPLDLVVGGTLTHPDNVPIGDQTLQVLFELDPIERRALVAEVAGSLPDDVIAHRLGDFVGTWHGVDPNGEEGAIWLVVVSPDPDLNRPGSNTMITVGLRDGTVTSFPAAEIVEQLWDQNALRAAEGLPLLPIPETVRHDAPATAEEP